MKKLLIVAAMAVTSSLFAQLEFGFLGGLSLSTQQASYDKSTRFSLNTSDFSIRPMVGINFGVLVQFNIIERLDLKVTPLYTLKGQKERTVRASSGSTPAGDGIEYKDKIGYVGIPAELVYNLGPKQHHGPFVSLGIYMAKAVSAKSHYSDYDNDIEQECDVAITSDIDNWKPNTLYVKGFDFGLKTGIGYRFKSYMVSLSNEYGLVNNIPQVTDTAGNPLAEYSNQSIRKNISWGLSVAYIPLIMENGDKK
jgi:opacity protein-like surface antigen